MWIRFERGVGGFPSRARSLMRRPWTLLAEYSGTTWSKSPSNCEKAARSRSKVTTLSTESSQICTGLRYHFRQMPTSHSRGWENTSRSKIRLGLRKILDLETPQKGYRKETRALPNRQQQNTLSVRIKDPGMANLAHTETLLYRIRTIRTQRIYPLSVSHSNDILVCTG